MSSKQYFFVHLPKCAGTSVLKSLARIGGRRYMIVSESPYSNRQALKDMRAEMDRRKQNIEDIDLIFGHDVFYAMQEYSSREAAYLTILREPVERYVSHYRFFSKCATNRFSKIHTFARNTMMPDNKMLSLEECVERKYWSNLMTNHLATAKHPHIGASRIEPVPEIEQLQLATDFMNEMSFVGFVETIDSDMQTLCEIFGLKYKLRTVNQSKARTPEAIADETLDRIKQINLLDQQVYELGLQRKATLAENQ